MITINAVSEAVASFNARPAADAERDVLACCAVPAWARGVVAARPYPDLDALLAAADAGLRRLTWTEVAQALAAHPRIGERPTGSDRESVWSRREQAGVAGADAATRAALAEANREYEQRFGHLFLICASGRSQSELLAAARERLANDDEAERRVVREELRKIALLRLEGLLNMTRRFAGISTHVLDTGRGEPARDVRVRLDRRDGGGWTPVAEARTDGDGRLRDWVPAGEWRAGGYRLVFFVEAYVGFAAFFPEITVAFQVRDPDRHHHVPLLLSNYGYTTYLGS